MRQSSDRMTIGKERGNLQSRMFLVTALAALLTALVVALWGCGTARRSEPILRPMPLATPALVQGHRVFLKHCDMCHPHGEDGFGPAINNKPLPGFMMKVQVRLGAGDMPGFSERYVSDEELDSVVAYLKALRRHR